MASICLNFRGSGFQISDPIQNLDHLKSRHVRISDPPPCLSLWGGGGNFLMGTRDPHIKKIGKHSCRGMSKLFHGTYNECITIFHKHIKSASKSPQKLFNIFQFGLSWQTTDKYSESFFTTRRHFLNNRYLWITAHLTS